MNKNYQIIKFGDKNKEKKHLNKLDQHFVRQLYK